jgi:general secretion pathway protein A
MYEEFYGLDARPFDLTPDPRYLVLTAVHREALSNLEYAIGSRKGVTLLLGDAGTGKTTIIRSAIARQPARSHCVHLHNPALTRGEFVQMLAAQFSLSERARTSKTDLLLELEQLLRTRRDAQETTVLIVDEAQTLTHELLEEVRLLTNIETDAEKLLSLVIAGQPEFASRLAEPSLRQLKQRVALRCELRPLTLLETCAYVAGRIAAAGGIPAKMFTREAVILIHEYARGNPRTINVIADNALLGGFATGQRTVTRQRVFEACADFDIAAPVAAPREPAPPVGLTASRSSETLSTSDLRTVDSAVAGSQPSARGRGEKLASWLRRRSASSLSDDGDESLTKALTREGVQ